jgi:hypothetical protein
LAAPFEFGFPPHIDLATYADWLTGELSHNSTSLRRFSDFFDIPEDPFIEATLPYDFWGLFTSRVVPRVHVYELDIEY